MSNANTAWILTSTALVLFMTLPGLALFYAGLVRSKNTISVLAQCLVIAVLASMVWFVVGYSLSFSGEGLYIGDLSKVFLKTINLKSLTGDIPETVFCYVSDDFLQLSHLLLSLELLWKELNFLQ